MHDRQASTRPPCSCLPLSTVLWRLAILRLSQAITGLIGLSFASLNACQQLSDSPGPALPGPNRPRLQARSRSNRPNALLDHMMDRTPGPINQPTELLGPAKRGDSQPHIEPHIAHRAMGPGQGMSYSLISIQGQQIKHPHGPGADIDKRAHMAHIKALERGAFMSRDCSVARQLPDRWMLPYHDAFQVVLPSLT